MASTRYGVPIWPSVLPRAKRPRYPRLRGHHEREVVIIGGGLTGCATAYALAVSGVSVLLLEADAVGVSASGRGSGVVVQHPDTDFAVIKDTFGLRAGKRIWQMTRRAALDVAATVRRLGIACQLTSVDAVLLTTQEEHVRNLRREVEQRRAAGIEGSWLSAERIRQATKLVAVAGVRTRGHFTVDPYRLCLGFARAAIARGAVVHERTEARRIKNGQSGVTVTVDGGTILAQRVIVTTGSSTTLFRPLARHVTTRHSYVVLTPPLGAKLRRELGPVDTVLADREQPSHYLRWTRDNRVLFGGADQPEPPRRTREKVLIQRTGQLMYELSTLYPVISGIQPEFAWEAPVATTADALPLIGPHRHFPGHLFALGIGHSGVMGSFLASRLLVRHHLGTLEKGDELFGFTRS